MLKVCGRCTSPNVQKVMGAATEIGLPPSFQQHVQAIPPR
jgi:hypothetical protein